MEDTIWDVPVKEVCPFNGPEADVNLLMEGKVNLSTRTRAFWPRIARIGHRAALRLEFGTLDYINAVMTGQWMLMPLLY